MPCSSVNSFGRMHELPPIDQPGQALHALHASSNEPYSLHEWRMGVAPHLSRQVRCATGSLLPVVVSSRM